MSELLSTAALLKAQAEDLRDLPLIDHDGALGIVEPFYPVKTVLEALATIRDAKRILTDVDLADHVGGRWPRDEAGELLPFVEVPGVGAFERHAKKDGAPKVKDDDDLYRLVLDTRVVDEETGEVLGPLEVAVLAYGSKSRKTGKVRLTGTTPAKLRAIGIDPDEHFEANPRTGWTVTPAH
jgi:hypothetical protein